MLIRQKNSEDVPLTSTFLLHSKRTRHFQKMFHNSSYLLSFAVLRTVFFLLFF